MVPPQKVLSRDGAATSRQPHQPLLPVAPPHAPSYEKTGYLFDQLCSFSEGDDTQPFTHMHHRGYACGRTHKNGLSPRTLHIRWPLGGPSLKTPPNVNHENATPATWAHIVSCPPPPVIALKAQICWCADGGWHRLPELRHSFKSGPYFWLWERRSHSWSWICGDPKMKTWSY